MPTPNLARKSSELRKLGSAAGRKTQMAIIWWFKRLLGLSTGEAPKVLSSDPRLHESTAMSAAEALQRVNELKKANSQWPENLATDESRRGC